TTKKVKRPALRKLLEGLQAGESIAPPSNGRGADSLESAVRSLVANIGRRKPQDVGLSMTLRGDLGFDSLMALELLVGLEAKLGRTLDGEELSRASTVAELVSLLQKSQGRAASRTTTIEGSDD